MVTTPTYGDLAEVILIDHPLQDLHSLQHLIVHRLIAALLVSPKKTHFFSLRIFLLFQRVPLFLLILSHFIRCVGVVDYPLVNCF